MLSRRAGKPATLPTMAPSSVAAPPRASETRPRPGRVPAAAPRFDRSLLRDHLRPHHGAGLHLLRSASRRVVGQEGARDARGRAGLQRGLGHRRRRDVRVHLNRGERAREGPRPRGDPHRRPGDGPAPSSSRPCPRGCWPSPTLPRRTGWSSAFAPTPIPDVGRQVRDVGPAGAPCRAASSWCWPPFPRESRSLIVEDTTRTLRISNGVAVACLFLAGWSLGRATGLRAWLLGLAMVVLGSSLVAITVALGG